MAAGAGGSNDPLPGAVGVDLVEVDQAEPPDVGEDEVADLEEDANLLSATTKQPCVLSSPLHVAGMGARYSYT